MNKQESRRARLVYCGRQLGRSGLVYAYQVEGTGAGLDLYKKTLRAGTPVGAVLEVSLTPEGSVMGGSDHPRVVVGSYGDESVVAGWLAAEAADVVIYEREALSKRRAREVRDPLAEHFEALAAAYDKLSGIGRKAAFLDYVSQRIQRVSR